jgi:hypothetical protein
VNRIQKTVFTILMVDLCGILYLQHLLADNFAIMGVVLYMVILSLAGGSLMAPRPSRLHRIVGRAILFIAVGDFFLVFMGTLPMFGKEDLAIKVPGMIGFICAYSTLIWLFTRKFSLGKKDLFMLLPVLIVITPVLYTLLPLIEGPMFYFAIFFTFIVSFMAWNGLCIVHRGFYTRKVAVRFAIAGFLMLLSDMGVAFVMFYPGMQSNVPWLENEIWITYVPAWTLVFLNLLEEKLVD